MDKYVWLVFSAVKKGCFCKYFTVFASDQAGRCFHQKLGQLVLEPYMNWKNALEDFSKHQSNSYHREAVIWGENFLAIMSRQKTSIVEALNTQKREEIKPNRKWLRLIAETILMCGRQVIALRGDEDSGKFTFVEPVKNDGSFRTYTIA